MKKIGRITGLGASLLWCAALCFGLAGAAAAQSGERYCEVTLSKCPNEYDGKELVVPLDVIAFSAGVQACAIVDSTVSQGGDPPAIMFVIDHTNSMGTINDTRGNRYRVARALIDSVYRAYPAAEVGMVVFDAGLFLNSAKVTDRNLATFGGTQYYNPDSAVEKYMPLMRLDEPAFGGGFYSGTGTPNAIDVYRSMLVAGAGVNATSGIRNPSPAPGASSTFDNGSGTNVSIAFEAALEQFKNSTVAKENQYIIFISDGRYEMHTGLVNGGCDETAVPTGPGARVVGDGVYGNSARCPKQRDFMYGEIGGQGIPTTYTVFFNTDAQATMRANRATLDTMTTAIKNNGYSAVNASSDIWTVDGNNYNNLLTLMMENIISPMLTKTSGAPKRIVITSSGGAADSAGTIDEGNFTFSRQLPIDTSDITTVKMSIRYTVTVDSVDAAGNPVVVPPKDSDFEYSFTVRRSADVPDDWETSQDLTPKCENKPTLDLRYGEESVKEVKGNMDRLTVRLDNTGGLFDYQSVVVQVRNADGSFTDVDVENFTLTKSGNIWTYEFPRLVAGFANSGDNTLQHAQEDSIIVVFRNPYIPLDTLRVSVPYVSTRMAFYDKPGDPSGGTEFSDPVKVTAGEVLDIYAKFFDSYDMWDESMESDPSKFTWTVGDQNNAKLEYDGAHGRFYSETAGRVYTVTATFRDGSMTLSRSLQIEVVPAEAHYLQVVFDTTKVTNKADTGKLKEPKEYEFGKDADKATFFVVERDRFGNYIGPAVGAEWIDDDAEPVITAAPQGDGSFALVSRHGNSFVDGLKLTVRKGALSDVVNIKVVGASSVAVGPNPFVPGKSDVGERLQQLDGSGKTYDYYRDIIERNGPGNNGGLSVGVSNNGTGVLVAATAPKSIKRENGAPKATIVIYDAVGNVVFRSKPNDVALTADGNTFGFVWDGKNANRRTVGPGTYLVKMVATLSDDTKFTGQRKVGVTVEGNTR